MLFVATSAIVSAVVLGVWFGSRHQLRAAAAQAGRLTHAAMSVPPENRLADLDGLPPPVERYLRRALPQAASMRLVRLSQTGILRTDIGSSRWMPFEAEHLVAPGAVGFLWNARVTVAPALHVRVRDAFIEGEGSGQVSLLSAFPVSADANTPEMNAGSLHRFLAEAVW